VSAFCVCAHARYQLLCNSGCSFSCFEVPNNGGGGRGFDENKACNDPLMREGVAL
jgi:hypothetical protein